MAKRITIQNRSGSRFHVTLEPLPAFADVPDGESIAIEDVEFDQDELTIQILEDNLLVVWAGTEAFFPEKK